MKLNVSVPELRQTPIRVSSLAVSKPKLMVEQKGMKLNLMAVKDALPATDPNAVEIYGPNGVIIRDTGGKTVVTLTPDGITITLGGDLVVNANGFSVTVNDGDIDVESVPVFIDEIVDKAVALLETDGDGDTDGDEEISGDCERLGECELEPEFDGDAE